METFTIYGDQIECIADFYDQINTLFMQGETWKIAQSLDALHDLLSGGIGAVPPTNAFELQWLHSAISRNRLGVKATEEYYLSKLSPHSPYNQAYFRQKLKELQRDGAPTYYDMIREIISEHSRIQFREE